MANDLTDYETVDEEEVEITEEMEAELDGMGEGTEGEGVDDE